MNLLFSCTYSMKKTSLLDNAIAVNDLDYSLKGIQAAIKKNQYEHIVGKYTENVLYLDSEIKVSSADDKRKAIENYFSIQQVTFDSPTILNKKVFLDRGNNLLRYKSKMDNGSVLLTDVKGYTEIQLFYSSDERRWKLQSLNSSHILSILPSE